jgi:uncharacterized protein YbjT (DUF2867 family)
MQGRRLKIAVAGGTGRVGHHVVEVLKSRGHDVVQMSRSTGVDVISGNGLGKALEGVECIVDATTGPSPEQAAATEFFVTATRNLQESGKRAGVKRIIVVSIIGIDRFTSGQYGGYYTAKQAHEKTMLSGPIPVRILRAAQFHEFVETLMNWGTKGDVSYLPKMRTQLVAARTVAEALADLAIDPRPITASSNAPIPEIAGPKEENLADAARRLVARRGDSLRIEAVSNPDDPAAALYESGALLPSLHAKLAGPTFDEWLEVTIPAKPAARPFRAA